jgi:hypothetical protein
VVSLLGDLGLERGYYHCKSCGQGHVPWDNVLRLSPQRLTPAAQEVTTLTGIVESFGEAADRTLAKLTGLRLSESTVQRTTEAAGKQLGERLQQGKVFGTKQTWDWHQDVSQHRCAYVSVDATGILMQGESPGSQADGRMVYVAMVFNPRPRLPGQEALAMPCDGSRYLAGLYTLPELGLQLRRQAAQVGMDAAEQWIALTDGGNGLEEFIDVNFPRAVKILDFQHVAGYVNDFAKAFRSGGAGAKLAEAWCHTLKHAGGARLIQVLERLDRKKMSEPVQVPYDKLLQYLRNHVDRMKYPEYLRQGWQIASGAVESACKTVVNRRLCMGGMRWGEYGADGVAHLRALYRSDPDQWESYWTCANLALAA